MFAESLLENTWAQRSRRGLTTLSSFGLQAIIIGSLIFLSLLRSVVMPSAQVVSTPIFASRLEPEPLSTHPHSGSSAAQNNVAVIRLMQPARVPTGIHQGANEASPELPSGPEGGIYGTNVGTGGPDLPTSLLGGTRAVMPIVQQPIVRQFRTSSMLEGSLLRKVQPVYPPLAKGARIQGPVVLAAVISKAGTIENLRALSGHPMLVGAAIDAVSQWRYRPYILNGEPVEVETRIVVNFTLSGN